MAGDGEEADFDLWAALDALDFNDDEQMLCEIAEKVIKELLPVEASSAKHHIAILSREISRSRLASSGLP